MNEKDFGTVMFRINVDIPLELLMKLMDADRSRVNNSTLWNKLNHGDVNFVDDIVPYLPDRVKNIYFMGVVSALATALNNNGTRL